MSFINEQSKRECMCGYQAYPIYYVSKHMTRWQCARKGMGNMYNPAKACNYEEWELRTSLTDGQTQVQHPSVGDDVARPVVIRDTKQEAIENLRRAILRFRVANDAPARQLTLTNHVDVAWADILRWAQFTLGIREPTYDEYKSRHNYVAYVESIVRDHADQLQLLNPQRQYLSYNSHDTTIVHRGIACPSALPLFTYKYQRSEWQCRTYPEKAPVNE